MMTMITRLTTTETKHHQTTITQRQHNSQAIKRDPQFTTFDRANAITPTQVILQHTTQLT